ncbi:hypothetical protein TTHERM_001287955 (macronuclear) [Tetrahymena thermophila SB210]|uniref:Uncharacterized protein n=1 Tax=Tetrahymena thermophila (strain SB210) TaxID=312017 RepID=W7XCU4_TETTS|nr:hypothetical protein TTHERM_001287955 [Tetrahymena thermophila SB210]EWS71621.1 hypothetical protein TTHERM_001287955 [Tetrahymena thermophila SB210]|eukprot:XP_012655842.1 hypothetical protein TTHERM_001287955 [Tetrahymena thermophila SB210]
MDARIFQIIQKKNIKIQWLKQKKITNCHIKNMLYTINLITMKSIQKEIISKVISVLMRKKLDKKKNKQFNLQVLFNKQLLWVTKKIKMIQIMRYLKIKKQQSAYLISQHTLKAKKQVQIIQVLWKNSMKRLNHLILSSILTIQYIIIQKTCMKKRRFFKKLGIQMLKYQTIMNVNISFILRRKDLQVQEYMELVIIIAYQINQVLLFLYQI